MKRVLFTFFVCLIVLGGNTISQELIGALDNENVACSNVQNISFESAMDSAKTLYDEGSFDESINLYECLLSTSKLSSSLLYNLGNAYFKRGDYGRSVLNYEKALLLNPENENATYNLNLINSKLQDEFESIPFVGASKFFLAINGVVHYWLWATLGFVSILFFLLRLYLAKKKKQSIVFGNTWMHLVVGCVIYWLSWSQYSALQSNGDYAIVMTNNNAISSEPNNNSTVIMRINTGTKVSVIQDAGEWKEVRCPDASTGWIKSGNLELVQIESAEVSKVQGN